MNGELVFPLAPSDAPFVWLWVLMGVFAAVLIAVGSLVYYTVFSAKHATLLIQADGVRINAGWFSRTIDGKDVVLDGVRVVDLTQESEYQLKPHRKGRGTNLPGLKAGWFTLKSGHRGLVFLTDMSRVVYIPTTSGQPVLFSTPDPEALAESLKNHLVRMG